jgi:LPXTG-site transpeptidase (sortase) family protein
MNFNKAIRIFGVSLIILSLFALVPIGYFWVTGKIAAAQPAKPIQHMVLKPSVDLITGTPTHLTIPSLNIDLVVEPGEYNTQTKQWTLSLDKAHFATPSVAPNNLAGNTLIYGHYRPEVFAYLHNITPGSTATVTTDNGYEFSYTFERTEALDPADTSIFMYQGKPRLTIQTCSGAFMQNRQMYYFHYDGYKKI